MACMAEAIARSGDFHYGQGLIKELAANYLGQAGSFILSLAVVIRVFFIVLACYVGLSVTMANFTPISASIWAALLFGIGIYFLSRKSIKFTVAIMVLLAVINIALLLILSLLALTHLEINNLFYTNLSFLDRNSFKPQLIQQICGVSLMLYFGHVYVGESAKLILPKDPSGSSLFKGSIAGTLILTALFCIWIVAVNGAIAPSLLTIESGTVLKPLAEQIGSVVTVIGSILVIFLLGMAWIRSSTLLFNLTQEWIPSQHQHTLVLPAQKGRLILRQPKAISFPSLGLTYLGLKQDYPQFHLDIQTRENIIRTNLTFSKSWEFSELALQFSEVRHLTLRLNLLSVTKNRVYLQVNSPLIVSYEGKLENFASDLLVREETNQPIKYLQKIKNRILAQRSFLIGIIPLIIAFLLVEWLFFAKTQSFTSVLSFAGILGNSLVGGIFPVLLLISSRHKGEIVPKITLSKLDHPWLLGAIYSLFITILVIHGLFIWDNVIAKFSAFAVAFLALCSTLITIFAGALTPRTTIEICPKNNRSNIKQVKITSDGKPKTLSFCLGYENYQKSAYNATIELDYLDRLKYAICQLSSKSKTELKIWVHCHNLNGNDKNLPMILEVRHKEKTMRFDLKLAGNKFLLPVSSSKYWLKFSF